MSIVGDRHCPLSPLGPRIECLERVSSFGGGRVKDLQKASKNESNHPLVNLEVAELEIYKRKVKWK